MQKGSALSRLQYASSGTYIKYLGTVDINATSKQAAAGTYLLRLVQLCP